MHTNLAPAPTIDRPRYSLLVVDDEAGPRQSIRMVFKNDFHVHTVESGEQALDFARANPVHIAILDIRMAGKSGIDVLRGLKEIDPHIEVIMLTAYETLETARQALRLGACDYLSKPFNLSAIREAADRAVRLRAISENIASTSERLKALNDQLQDSTFREEVARTANEIYAGVIHDINNPLTIISGYIGLFEQRLTSAASLHGKDLEQLRSDIAMIARQVNTCGGIATRYLSFLRQRQEAVQETPVNQILADLEALLQHHPVARDREIAMQYLAHEAVVPINGTALLQVLLNLTINALQSSNLPQTVRIAASRIEQPLELSGDPKEARELRIGASEFANRPPFVAITVSDRGCGISADLLPRIFDAYFTTKQPGKGTGLGLSIVARIIRSSGALLRLTSIVGRGTEVTVFFSTGH